MKIRALEFIGAMGRAGDPNPATLPQIAFSGRSNVGKSSLINRLLGRTRTPIARVSATPGKTQEVNFFRVVADLPGRASVEFILTDLPGYGFARVPLAVKEAWQPLIESYLSTARDLRGVVQLIDMRHPPKPDDQRMLDFLADRGLPTMVALTKADKVPASRRRRREEELVEALGADADQVVAVSARTGDGCEDLWSGMGALLQEAS